MERIIVVSCEEIKSIVASAVNQALENFSQRYNAGECQKSDDDLLTTVEVCLLLKISKVTLHSYIKKGLIPRKRIGRRNLFSKSEILSIVNKNKSDKAFLPGTKKSGGVG
jgi:excisionase family DNA binding protein